MTTGYTLGKWSNGLAEWTEGDVAFLSVAFTWRIHDAVTRAHWLKAEGKRVVAGGPALFLRSVRDLITHVAEVHTKVVERDGHTREVLKDLHEVFPGMDGGALIHHNPMATVASRGCPVGCHFCMPPETLIETESGLKRIDEIQVGDLVLTHKGRYRPVSAVMSRPYEGDLIKIESDAVSKLFPARFTPGHPILTRRVTYYTGGPQLTEYDWTASEEVIPERSKYARDVLVKPRLKETETSIDGMVPNLPGVPLTKDFMALLGWYVAEGYLSTTDRRGTHSVTFCLGKTKQEGLYAEEIVARAAACGYHSRPHRASIGYRPVINSVSLARWLKNEFGHGASEKKLPLWLRRLPEEFLTPFLEAWVKGDGWEHVKKGNPTRKVTTVSPHLAVQLREIVLKIGKAATINKHKQNDLIEGRRVKTKPAYTVIYRDIRKTRTSTTDDADGTYMRIRPSKRETYCGMVHNIEVEEDNSYCTPAFAVHNCIVPPLEGLTFTYLPDFPVRPVLTDNNLSAIDPLYQQHIVDRYIAAGVPLLDANSGFEPATFDEEVYRRWEPINKGVWRMAYDETKEGADVERAITMLRRNGVPPRRIQVYVLIGNEPEEQCMARIRQVVEWGGEPYAQPIMKLNSLTRSAWLRYDWGSEQRLRQVQRWTNGRFWRGPGGAFRGFDEYNPSARKAPDQFYDQQLGLYGEAA